MADEPQSGGPVEMAIFIFGILAVLVALWFMNGGPEKTDLRGIFLHPLAPVGSGDAYGPKLGTTTIGY